MARQPRPPRVASASTGARAVRPTSRLSQTRRMRLFSSWLRRSWTTLLLGVLVVAVGMPAFINLGVEATELKLNEGAVYVQSQDRQDQCPELQIDEISGRDQRRRHPVHLLQEGRTVVINNAGSSTLQTYDPASTRCIQPVRPADQLADQHERRRALDQPREREGLVRPGRADDPIWFPRQGQPRPARLGQGDRDHQRAGHRHQRPGTRRSCVPTAASCRSLRGRQLRAHRRTVGHR